jgi:hypothetical protein
MSHQGVNVGGVVALIVAGMTACDGGSDGTPLGPEGVPIATALPAASAWCIITRKPSGEANTASWDAPSRTFSFDGLYWKVDERLRVVEEGTLGDGWRKGRTYDAYGATATSFEEDLLHETEILSYYENEHDAAGRLTASVVSRYSGDQKATIDYQYQYQGDHLINVATTTDGVGRWTRFTWEGDRVVTREVGNSTSTERREVRSYDGSGRLERGDFDGGFLAVNGGTGDSYYTTPDGTPDQRHQWTHDAAGRIATFDEDAGTALFPTIDGVSEAGNVYDPACAAIAVVPGVLYQFESWLAPR